MRSMKVGWESVNHAAILYIRAVVNCYLVPFLRYSVTLFPPILCYRQGETPIRGDNFSLVRRGVLCITPTLAFVNDNRFTSRFTLPGILLPVFCISVQRIIFLAKRREILFIRQWVCINLADNTAIMRESWIVNRHLNTFFGCGFLCP